MPFSHALTGSDVPAIDPRLLAGILGGTAALGLLASLLPTRLAPRMQPADAIGLEE